MALAELQKLQKVIDSAKDLTGKLRAENDKVVTILDEYTERILNPTKNSNTVGHIRNGLTEIKNDLDNLEKQATDELVIEFVGAENSGKSSLINAVLREDILPTSCGESTMCSFKICTTDEERWSVQKDGGEKSYGRDVEEVKKLYCKMSGSTIRERQREMAIKTESVVQVNWPQNLCATLPKRVVMYDTPGCSEDEKVANVVKESCKTADIIVAVMDTMSPSFREVSNLVKNADCKFTFGVFTKWDEFMQRNRKGNVSVDEKYFQEVKKKKYYSMVDRGREARGKAVPRAEEDVKVGAEPEMEGADAKTEREAKANEEEEEEKVFFVDVGCVEHENLMIARCQGLPSTNMQVETDGSAGNKGFLKFEKRLAESAKKLIKGEIITERTKSVTLKAENVFNKFQGIIDTRRQDEKAKLDRLEDDIASLKADRKSFSEFKKDVRNTREIMKATFTEDVIEALNTEFEKNVKECKSEEEVIEKFLDNVNDRIKCATDTETRNVKRKYEEWKNNLKASHNDLSQSLPDYQAPHLKYQELPEEYYNKSLDPHTFITSKVLWGIVVAGTAIGSGVATVAALPAAGVGAVVPLVAEGASAANAVTAVAGFAATFVGGGLSSLTALMFNLINGNKIMGKKKIKAWEKFEAKKIQSMTEKIEYTEPVLKEINRIYIEISYELKRLSDDSAKERPRLAKEIEDLNKWAADLRKSTDSVKEVKGKFEELLKKLMSTAGDLEDETENQSATNSAGTSV